MVITEIINVNGNAVHGVCIKAPGGEGHPNMLVIEGKKGYIMCGYLSLDTAIAVNDVACVIGGATFEEQLANPVRAVTPEAEKLGIKIGMTGAEVCDILNA